MLDVKGFAEKMSCFDSEFPIDILYDFFYENFPQFNHKSKMVEKYSPIVRIDEKYNQNPKQLLRKESWEKAFSQTWKGFYRTKLYQKCWMAFVSKYIDFDRTSTNVKTIELKQPRVYINSEVFAYKTEGGYNKPFGYFFGYDGESDTLFYFKVKTEM